MRASSVMRVKQRRRGCTVGGRVCTCETDLAHIRQLLLLFLKSDDEVAVGRCVSQEV